MVNMVITRNPPHTHALWNIRRYATLVDAPHYKNGWQKSIDSLVRECSVFLTKSRKKMSVGFVERAF